MPRYHEGARIIYNGVHGTISFIEQCTCDTCVGEFGEEGMINYEIELDEFDEFENDFYCVSEGEIQLLQIPRKEKGFAKFIKSKGL